MILNRLNSIKLTSNNVFPYNHVRTKTLLNVVGRLRTSPINVLYNVGLVIRCLLSVKHLSYTLFLVFPIHSFRIVYVSHQFVSKRRSDYSSVLRYDGFFNFSLERSNLYNIYFLS